MTYTRQQVLDFYNQERGTSFTLVSLAQYLLSKELKSELRTMLKKDAQVLEESQVNNL